MRLTSVSIQNFRCFAKFHLELHPQLNVIVAPNGGGKTALLDAINILLTPFVHSIHQGGLSPATGFNRSDVRRIKVRRTELNEMEACDDIKIACVGEIDNENFDILFDHKGRVVDSARTNGARIRKSVSDGTRPLNMALPAISYYRSSRINKDRSHNHAYSRKQRSRLDGYRSSLNASADVEVFEEWFEYLCKAEFEKKMELAQEGSRVLENEFTDLISGIREALDRCLAPTGWTRLDYRAKLQELAVEHPLHGLMPFEVLSDGVRTILAMVGDLASRATQLNPQLGKNAPKNTPGIVLIDEIDLHLHPEWQRTIVRDLIAAFPEVQFIITTHSPHIVSGVPRECVRQLKWVASSDEMIERLPDDVDSQEGKVLVAEIPDAQTEGERVSSVASDVFGVGAWPDLPIVHDLRRYRSLVDQGLYDTEEAVGLKERLVAHYGAEHEELMAAEISVAGQRARRAAQGA